MIVTVTPNPALDRTLELSGPLLVGELHRAASVVVEPSGKGVNMSRSLASNGFRTVAVLPVGGAEGLAVTALLDREGVRHRTLGIAGNTRVDVAAIGPDGSATKVNEQGPELTADEAEAFERLAGDVLVEATRTGPAGSWLVGAGALPRGVPSDFYARIGRLARESGVRFALDASGEALRHGLAAGPEVLAPNRDELAELTGTRLDSLGAAVEAAEGVRRNANVATVLIGLGDRGALLVDGVGALHASADVARVRNPTGGGDALLAGYLAGLENAGPSAPNRRTARESAIETARESALREAVAWASSAVRSLGSLGAPVTDADRAAVRLDRAPDPSYAL